MCFAKWKTLENQDKPQKPTKTQWSEFCPRRPTTRCLRAHGWRLPCVAVVVRGMVLRWRVFWGFAIFPCKGGWGGGGWGESRGRVGYSCWRRSEQPQMRIFSKPSRILLRDPGKWGVSSWLRTETSPLRDGPAWREFRKAGHAG